MVGLVLGGCGGKKVKTRLKLSLMHETWVELELSPRLTFCYIHFHFSMYIYYRDGWKGIVSVQSTSTLVTGCCFTFSWKILTGGHFKKLSTKSVLMVKRIVAKPLPCEGFWQISVRLMTLEKKKTWKMSLSIKRWTRKTRMKRTSFFFLEVDDREE